MQQLRPVYTRSLVGRAAETQALLSLLDQPTTRLLTLIGASGTGKTRLALEVIQALETRGAAPQIIFVGLAAITSPELVLPTIARHLDIREDGQLPLIETMSATLADRPLLLVLDNFEQVLAAASVIASLLARLPQLQVLITSQEPLSIAAEQIYAIPGLALPELRDDLAPVEALAAPAVELFVSRLQTVQPHFQLSPDHVAAVVKICQLVEGLPLAIELLAAYSDVFSPSDLLPLIEKNLAIQSLRHTALSGREKILRPVLDWCYSRLKPSEQRVFSCLGVFHGGWNLAALQAVCADILSSAEIAHALKQLQLRNLVLTLQVEGDQERFMMLDAIHEFAARRLRTLPQRAQILRQHAAYFEQLTAQADAGLRGSEQVLWMQRMEYEQPNVRAALAWAYRWQPQTAIQTAINAGQFWYMVGYLSEGVQWYEQMLTLPLDRIQRMTILRKQGLLLKTLGLYEQATAVLHQGLESARALGPEHIISCGSIANTLGMIMTDHGRYAEAQTYLSEAADAMQASGDMMGFAIVRSNQGNLALLLKQFDVALALYNSCLTIEGAAENPLVQALAYTNIGAVNVSLLQPEAALVAAEQGLLLAQQLKSPGIQAMGNLIKAQAHIQQAKLDLVPQELLKAASLFMQSNEQPQLSITLESIAVFLAKSQHRQQAAYLIGAADAARTKIGAPRQGEDTLVEQLLSELASAADAQQLTAQRQRGTTVPFEHALDQALQWLDQLPISPSQP